MVFADQARARFSRSLHLFSLIGFGSHLLFRNDFLYLLDRHAVLFLDSLSDAEVAHDGARVVSAD